MCKEKTVPDFITSTPRKGSPTRFSIVPLLLANPDISAEARQALVENRLREAAGFLMHEHGLNCLETGHLLGISACDP
jgi:hypothetical protein